MMRLAASSAVLLKMPNYGQAARNLGEEGFAERLRSGDRKAFAIVYERHLEFVMQMLTHGFTYRGSDGKRHRIFIPNAYDVEDLCQKAFAELLRQCINGNFDASREIRPYLRAIVAHLAMRKVGHAAKEDLLEEPPELQIEPDHSLEDAECERLMLEFRSTLNPSDEAIISGCFEQSRSQAQVGDALGLSRDQVYRAILKIRKRARAFFKTRGWFDGT